ncbi:MAG: hypothetical protein LKI93_00030 [Bifidobacteriaceae bacterium]|jgi:hypothetical protein|nr:hypothetical protein [Bifidobacteriaceae bacterium]MCI1914108.1 hypothetical protein [Bifidobacteriaceae bacterium]
MFKRLFWIGLGAGIGIVAVTKAKAYLRARTPDAPRQFFLGPDSQDEDVPMRTLRALYAEFEQNRQLREDQLNQRLVNRSAPRSGDHSAR